MIRPVRPTSTVEEAASVLEDSIFEGDFAPGAWLRETDLSQELGISRNTLRQAFQALARSGLVEHQPNRGVRVATPRRDDVADILSVRRLLEDAALARCARPEDLGRRLLGIADEIEVAETNRAWARLVDLDLRFHEEIVNALGSQRLDRFFDDSLRELRLAFILIDSRAAQTSDSLPHVSDHRAIADALAQGERARARELLARHLEATETLLSTAFKEE